MTEKEIILSYKRSQHMYIKYRLTVLMISFYIMQPCSTIGYIVHGPKTTEKQPTSKVQEVKDVSPNRIVQKSKYICSSHT